MTRIKSQVLNPALDKGKLPTMADLSALYTKEKIKSINVSLKKKKIKVDKDWFYFFYSSQKLRNNRKKAYSV